MNHITIINNTLFLQQRRFVVHQTTADADWRLSNHDTTTNSRKLLSYFFSGNYTGAAALARLFATINLIFIYYKNLKF